MGRAMSEPAPTYGDVTAEYLALRTAAGLVTGRAETVWATGPDTITFLDSLLTQDIAAMASGEVARSLLLEPRGKLRALLWLLRGDEEVGLVTDAGYGHVVKDDLTRFKIRVKVDLADPEPMAELWGPASAEVLEAAGLPAPDGWVRHADAIVARGDLGDLPRYFVAGAAADLPGARRAGGLAADAVRIEAGEPRMGVDVGEKTIPQETGLVPATVSFTKGCYLGQELVARIDSRGHVNRHLRGVLLADNVLPPPGATLHAADREVGELTSLGESLELRAPVGLALVRREVAPGDRVDVRWEGGAAAATVAALPLDDFTGG